MIENDPLIQPLLRIHSLNCRGLTRETQLEIKHFIQNSDIVFLQETFAKLRQEEKEDEVILGKHWGFNSIQWKNGNRRRGVEFLISSKLEPLLLKTFCKKTLNLEALAIQIEEIIMIGAYIPIGGSTTGLQELMDILDLVIQQNPSSLVLLIGDLNARASCLGNKNTNASGILLDEYLSSENLYKVSLPKPTWNRGSQHSWIDVAIANRPIDLWLQEVQQKVYHFSDHLGLNLHIKTQPRNNAFNWKRPSMKAINKGLLRLKLSNDLNLQSMLNLIQSLTKREKVESARHLPACSYFKLPNQLKKQRDQLRKVEHKLGKSSKEARHLRQKYQCDLQREHRAQRSQFLQEAATTKSAQSFFSALGKSKPKKRWTVDTARGREHVVAEELRALEADLNPPTDYRKQEWTRLQTVPVDITEGFSVLEVKNLLKTLPRGKRAGPDLMRYEDWAQLDPRLLKDFTSILNEIFLEATFEKELLKVQIKPLTKKPGEPEIRPISLLNTLVKIVDRLFLSRLKLWCDEKNCLLPSQYGFRTGMSANDQILRLIETVRKSKRNNQRAMLLSVDLSKAYDRVDLEALYQTLIKLELPMSWRKYVHRLLFDRSFQVCSYSSHSDWYHMNVGVPQGLPSAPILFNIYLNECLKDIEDDLKMTTFPYADDNSILITTSQTTGHLERSTARAIKKVSQQYSKVQALLSPSKSKLVPFRNKSKKVKIAGIPLVHSHRVLGVEVDRLLKFAVNTRKVLKQARCSLNWLSQFYKTLSSKQIRRAYCAYIQSFLDYHLLPTWPLLSTHQRLLWTKLIYRAARLILKASPTIEGKLACREARILLPDQRYRLLLLRRHCKLKTHRLSLQRNLLTGRIKEAKLETYVELCTPNNPAGGIERLLQVFDEELTMHLEFNPARIPRLTGELTPLSHRSGIMLMIRLDQYPLRDLYHRQNRPGPDGVQHGRCRFCDQKMESWKHLWFECYHSLVQTARLLLPNTLTECRSVQEVLTRLNSMNEQVQREKEIFNFIRYLEL
jgi:hypothetical protein